MKLTLGDIAITSIGTSSGIFFGKRNTLKQFQNEKVINEVIGSLSGKENTLSQGYWVTNKVKEG